MMQKWEYMVLSRVAGNWTDDRFDARTPAEKLTNFGNDHWELVSAFYDGSGYHFYLKRPIEQKSTTKKSKARSKVEDLASN